MKITLEPIGVIHSPFKEQTGAPIQPRFARDAVGEVEIFEPFVAGLKDIEGFERIWLIFHLDRGKPWKPLVVPYLDTIERGLFSTRAPSRPCPVGLSPVELLSVSGNILKIRGFDMLDGTPLLDIKPYVPRFDAYPESRAGWTDQVAAEIPDADDRFAKK